MHLRQNRCCLESPQRSKTITRAGAIGSASPVTKIASAYSKAVISPTATMETSTSDGSPMRAGFQESSPSSGHLGPVAAVIQGGAQNELRHSRSKFPPGVPSLAPPSEPSRMRSSSRCAKGTEPNLAPVPRGLLERYVTGFRDLAAVYSNGVSHWNKRR
jgi:hypothetical protein